MGDYLKWTGRCMNPKEFKFSLHCNRAPIQAEFCESGELNTLFWLVGEFVLTRQFKVTVSGYKQ